MSPDAVTAGVPDIVFAGFQSAFAIIAVALVSGAVADRMKFSAWAAFAALWALLVYFPAAHAVFSFDTESGHQGGFVANVIGAIDFAGGTAIHINAGVGALALCLVLGKRVGFGRIPMRPHNLPLVMLGAGLLWFGWFGFNAGSALGANTTAGVAWINTLGATAAAMLAWLLVERLRDGHATSLGAASGIVAGLVAITPAAHSVSPAGGLLVGAIAGALCAMAVGLKFRLGYDDSLDVVGVHLVGGLVGTLLIGLFADPATPTQAWPDSSTAAASSCWASRPRVPASCSCTPSSSPSSSRRSSTRSWACGSPPRSRPWASTPPSMPRPATTSATSRTPATA